MMRKINKNKLSSKQALKKFNKLQDEYSGEQLSNDPRLIDLEMRLQSAAKLVKKEGINAGD